MSLSLFRSDADPFAQMERRMNSLFRDFLSDFGQLSAPSSTASGDVAARGMGFWTPRSDFFEDDKAYTIHAELPGIDKKDVTVEVKDDYVRISGETKKKEERTEGSARYTERRHGRFERVYGLPKGGVPDKTQAKFENGVLEVTIPKKEPGEGVKRVAIQ